MTFPREQIIEWAREADPGFEGGTDADGTMGDSIVGIEAVIRFAALIEQAARADEREKCAKVCESLFDLDDDSCNEAEQCAAAIRARSDQ